MLFMVIYVMQIISMKMDSFQSFPGPHPGTAVGVHLRELVNSKYLFLTEWIWKSKIRVPTWSGSVKALFWM